MNATRGAHARTSSPVVATGVGTMARIAVRTGWKGLVGWALGMVALMAMTTTSIAALYDTPEKLQGYADSISGDAILVLNGKVAGIGTLGGVFANEFGFVLAFGIPLMAIALTSRGTRKDEEAGRLELMIAARIGRHAPTLAAVLVAVLALLLTGLGCGLVMAASGADAPRSLLYGLGISSLGIVFVGVTAVLAQVFEHNRAVWGAALVVVVAAYLARGVGAVNDSALLWLSPHGWVDEARAFGQARAWPLLLALAVGAALVGLAFSLSTRRDVGAALITPRGSKPRASGILRSPWGLALRQHRGAIIGWTLGAAVLMGTYGSLTQEVLDALRSNPALGEFMGADAASVEAMADGFVAQVMSTFVLMLALVVGAFVIMTIGSLRREESTARLEAELSGDLPRGGWLAIHVVVVALGAVVVGLVGALALGASAASSTGRQEWLGDIVGGAVPHLASVGLVLGVVVALFGVRPRLQPVAWGLFAAAAVVSYLGPGFDLPDWVLDAAVFPAVGSDVVGSGASTTGVLVLAVLAVSGVLAGFVGFRQRDIPVA